MYNYIREEIDPETREIIPRKFFSGGIDDYIEADGTERYVVTDQATLTSLDKLMDKNLVIAAMNAETLEGDRDEAAIVKKEGEPEIADDRENENVEGRIDNEGSSPINWLSHPNVVKLIEEGYDKSEDIFKRNSIIRKAINSLGSSVEARKEFFEIMRSKLNLDVRQEEETESFFQMRILIQTLQKVDQMWAESNKRNLSDEAVYLYNFIQTSIIEQREKQFSQDRIIEDQIGNNIAVYYYPSTGFVRKQLRIEVHGTGELVDWKKIINNVKLVGERLGGVIARVTPSTSNRREFHQLKRHALRHVINHLLLQAQKEAMEVFSKPLGELDDNELSQLAHYDEILGLIDGFSDRIKDAWGRGMLDEDPNMLNNYGAYIDRNQNYQVRMIDFSHLSSDRAAYYNESLSDKGVMDEYERNAIGINRLASGYGLSTQLGDYYLKNVAGEEDFKHLWPEDGDPILMHQAKRIRPVMGVRVKFLYEELQRRTQEKESSPIDT